MTTLVLIVWGIVSVLCFVCGIKHYLDEHRSEQEQKLKNDECRKFHDGYCSDCDPDHCLCWEAEQLRRQMELSAI